MISASLGDLDALRLMSRFGANFDDENFEGESPAILARPHPDCAAFILAWRESQAIEASTRRAPCSARPRM